MPFNLLLELQVRIQQLLVIGLALLTGLIRFSFWWVINCRVLLILLESSEWSGLFLFLFFFGVVLVYEKLISNFLSALKLLTWKRLLLVLDYWVCALDFESGVWKLLTVLISQAVVAIRSRSLIYFSCYRSLDLILTRISFFRYFLIRNLVFMGTKCA